MAQDNIRPPSPEPDPIYVRCIRPDLIDDIPASTRPTAVLVGGQPGAGKSYAAAQIRTHLRSTVGPAAHIAGDEIRYYHLAGRSQDKNAGPQPAQVDADVTAWHTRLIEDGIAKRANLVIETSMRQPEAVTRLAYKLRAAGYQVAAVVLAVDRDTSRQAMVARYDLAKRHGATERIVPGADHDTAYDRLRDTIAKLEDQHAVDRIQVITRDGRQLYANFVDQGKWVRQPAGLAALDDFRERRPPARELADSALRWQTLVQRLASDPGAPRGAAAQTVAWRNEATSKAERDADAKLLLQWGREAEAFRTMTRAQFIREFPHHARQAEKLEEAARYAEATFALAIDRDRFVAQARERLAERIKQGRAGAGVKAPEEKADRFR